MAFKSFSKLSSRNQSSLITQIHNLINYYSYFFAPRERNYLKKLSEIDGNIYWVEDNQKKLAATALIEPDHEMNFHGVKLKPLGYTLTKIPGQMENILHHIWSDYKNHSLFMCIKPSLACSLGLEELEMLELTPLDLAVAIDGGADLKTDYFNIPQEKLVSALQRKQQHFYIKLSPKDKKVLLSKFPFLEEKYKHIRDF